MRGACATKAVARSPKQRQGYSGRSRILSSLYNLESRKRFEREKNCTVPLRGFGGFLMVITNCINLGCAKRGSGSNPKRGSTPFRG